ncbi:hypothetical protein PIB30_031000 [Stylosanthes scabra]|uniref:Putative plant transposon protein domain-containing protein n=1 Tax=Stylosanthes scabra TaxID=79078 RepID=A0ABU6VET1_9FABA|nr:hypothetical protein [Stylosanthes scabra]
MADRKRKEKASSSSSEVPRFKTLFHEAHYKTKLSARKVLLELIIQVDESILSPCAFQIKQRKWEKFTNPIQAVGHNMVKEFYANTWEPDKEKRKPYTYTTMVRGKEISFAPSNIKRVLKLKKEPLPNAASYHERKANKDYRLDHVQEDLCIEGGEWVRHKDRRPHYLRRVDLEPMRKGWYDFVCRSILPTTNRSKLTVERAVLIHSIIIGENINVEEIIADQFYKFIYMTDLSSSLPFPMTIANLAIHRHREEEMNQERMRQNQMVQEATAERAREANKGKAREVVLDSEEEDSEELASNASEEW